MQGGWKVKANQPSIPDLIDLHSSLVKNNFNGVIWNINLIGISVMAVISASSSSLSSGKISNGFKRTSTIITQHCTLETTADKSIIFTVYTYSSELLDLMWFQCGRLGVIGIFGFEE